MINLNQKTYKVMDVSQLTDEELFAGNGILPKILVCERTKDINKLIKNCMKNYSYNFLYFNVIR